MGRSFGNKGNTLFDLSWKYCNQNIGPLFIMDKLFSLQTQIEGKQISIDVFAGSDLLIVSRDICKYYGLDSATEPYITGLITDQLSEALECDDYDLEWKYKLCTVLEQTFDRYEKENRFPAQLPTQYFKSNPAKTPIPATLPKRQPIPTLYEKALKLQRKKQERRQQGHLNRNMKELQECTFHPTINSNSTNTFRKKRLQQEDVYELLYHQAKSIENKRNRKIQQKISEETEGLTFAPQLNTCSLKIVEIKGRDNSTTTTTTCQRNTPKSKTQQFSFRPTISDHSKKLAKQMPNFWQRLERDVYHKCKVLEPSDSLNRTQQPALSSVPMRNGSQPKSTKNQSLTIKQREKQQQRRQRLYMLKPRTQPRSPQTREPCLNKRSIQILEKKKYRFFNSIFEQLQFNGVIEAQSIEQNACLMLQEHYQIIQPLLQEIIDLGVSLNRDEFVDSLATLYTSLSPQQKNILIGHDIKAKWDDEHQSYKNQFNFKPSISFYPISAKASVPTGPTMQTLECDIIEEDESECTQSSRSIAYQ